MLICAQLSGSILVSSGCVKVVLVVISGNCKVECVVRTLLCNILVVLGVNLVASVVCGLNAGVDISAVKSIAEQTESQVSLNIWVLGNGACIAVSNSCNRSGRRQAS